jgi:cytochrome b involved in lipid metabolism
MTEAKNQNRPVKRKLSKTSEGSSNSTDEDEGIRQFASLKEVADHQNNLKNLKSDQMLLVYRGVVYDGQQYAKAHPGGDRVLKLLAGKSIDKAFDEQGHADAAYYILQQLPIVGRVQDEKKDDGKLKEVFDKFESKFNFDYSRGMVWQMLNAQMNIHEYRTYLAQPRTLINPWRTVRLFDNPILEAITQGPWQQTPVGFLPIVVYLLWIN